MATTTNNNRILCRLPSAPVSGEAAANAIDALTGAGFRAAVISGGSSDALSAMAGGLAATLQDKFEYVYAFDCRGGLTAEEVLVRMSQFLSFHGVTDLRNIVLTPVPVDLKLESLAYFINRIRILVIFDGLESYSGLANHKLTSAVTALIGAKNGDARFIVTTRDGWEPPASIGGLVREIELPAEAPAPMSAPSGPAADSLAQLAAFDKRIPAGLLERAMGGGPVDIGALSAYIQSGGDPAHIRALEAASSMPHAKPGIELLTRAAEAHESYARNEQIIWQMLYASALYERAGETGHAARTASDAADTLLGWGFHDLALALLERASTQCDQKDRAAIMLRLGMAHERFEADERAIVCYREGIEATGREDSQHDMANCLFRLGTLNMNSGKLELAAEELSGALSIYVSVSDRENSARAHIQIGNLNLLTGDTGRAKESIETAIKIFETMGDKAGLAYAHSQLGSAHLKLDDTERAITDFESSLELYTSIKDKPRAAGVHMQLAAAHQKAKRMDKAMEHLQSALRLNEQSGNKAGAALVLHRIGVLLTDNGEYRPALRNLVLSLSIYENLRLKDKDNVLASITRIEEAVDLDEFKRINEAVMQELKSLGNN